MPDGPEAMAMGRWIGPRALVGGTLCLTALAIADAQTRRSADSTITYRARDASRLEALEPTTKAAHASQTTRRPVSDLVLRLRAWDGQPLVAALSSDGGGRGAADRPTFAAELIVAAAGRIHLEDRAACGPWRGDTALCRTECDGGAFALVRQAGSDNQSLKLQLGRVPAIAEAGFGEAVRLGACSDNEARGGLAVKAGGGTAEIVLEAR